MAPDWPSHRLNVESTVDFPEQNMKKWQIHWATMPASFWPFQQPPILFPGIKKEFGTFPRSELIWSIIPMFIPFENYGASISTKKQKLSTMWGISIRLSAEKNANHPMSTSTLTSRLLFSKKKVGSKPTKSLHKTSFSPKKNWGIPIYISYSKWETPTGIDR